MIENIDRLRDLAASTQFEPAEDYGCSKLSPRQQDAINVSHALLPGGKRITYLKTLQTSACERNCFYCPFRAGRDFRRASLKAGRDGRSIHGDAASGTGGGIVPQLRDGRRWDPHAGPVDRYGRNPAQALPVRGIRAPEADARSRKRPGRAGDAACQPGIDQPGSAQHGAAGAAGAAQSRSWKS